MLCGANSWGSKESSGGYVFLKAKRRIALRDLLSIIWLAAVWTNVCRVSDLPVAEGICAPGISAVVGVGFAA